MTATLTFKDETLAGKLIQEITVPVAVETMTLREIIMLRVEEEIRRREDEKYQRFLTNLADLTEQERLLNTGKRRALESKKSISDAPDPEAHGYRALEAFKRNAYFVLVDDKQVDELETMVRLTDKSTVSFVQLTPLVGG